MQKLIDDLLRRMTLEEEVARMKCIGLQFDMEWLKRDGKVDTLYGPADVRIGMGQYSLTSLSTSKNRRPHYGARSDKRADIALSFIRSGLPSRKQA